MWTLTVIDILDVYYSWNYIINWVRFGFNLVVFPYKLGVGMTALCRSLKPHGNHQTLGFSSLLQLSSISAYSCGDLPSASEVQWIQFIHVINLAIPLLNALGLLSMYTSAHCSSEVWSTVWGEAFGWLLAEHVHFRIHFHTYQEILNKANQFYWQTYMPVL